MLPACEETTKINLIVFDLIRQGLESTIYNTPTEHANYYTTNVASLLLSMIGGWTYTCVNIVYHPAALLSSINKTDFRNIAEIMFKFPLKSTLQQTPFVFKICSAHENNLNKLSIIP